VPPRKPSPVGALLSIREARAHAVLNDEREVCRALETASQRLGSSRPENSPSWVAWVNDAVLDGNAGRAWFELKRWRRAENRLARALSHPEDLLPRNRLLHSISLALTRLELRDVDGAAAAADDALQVDSHLASERVRTRLIVARKAFAAADSAVARDTTAKIQSVLGNRHPVPAVL